MCLATGRAHSQRHFSKHSPEGLSLSDSGELSGNRRLSACEGRVGCDPSMGQLLVSSLTNYLDGYFLAVFAAGCSAWGAGITYTTSPGRV